MYALFKFQNFLFWIEKGSSYLTELKTSRKDVSHTTSSLNNASNQQCLLKWGLADEHETRCFVWCSRAQQTNTKLNHNLTDIWQTRSVNWAKTVLFVVFRGSFESALGSVTSGGAKVKFNKINISKFEFWIMHTLFDLKGAFSQMSSKIKVLLSIKRKVLHFGGKN